MGNVLKLGICILVLVIGVLISLMIGTVNIFEYSLDDCIKILMNVRLSRVCAGIIVGISLGASGTLSQAMFQNSLASSDIIGVSSGAILSVILFYVGGFIYGSTYMVLVAAFIGAGIVSVFLISLVYSLNLRFSSLLLVGVSFSILCSAISSFIVSSFIFESKHIYSILYWLFGDLVFDGWTDIIILTPFLCILGILGYSLTYKLDVLSLGEIQSYSLGINTKKLKIYLIFIISFLVAISVSIAGGLCFIGLISPHISRLIIGVRHRLVFIFSCINGASLVVWADIISRYLSRYKTIQLGILTSVIGALFFLFLLLKSVAKKNGRLDV